MVSLGLDVQVATIQYRDSYFSSFFDFIHASQPRTRVCLSSGATVQSTTRVNSSQASNFYSDLMRVLSAIINNFSTAVRGSPRCRQLIFMFYRATSETRYCLRIYSGGSSKNGGCFCLPAYNVSMAAPLDGFDANTYRPRSPCWITPLSILDL